MGWLCAAAVLLSVVLTQSLNVKPPQVYVYTRTPLEHGKPNQVICHSLGFHPPKISMRLLANDQEIDKCEQSDLTFKDDWTYYTTRHGQVIHKDGIVYKCEVQHNDGDVKTHVFDNLS